jgi:hypothetical protein
MREKKENEMPAEKIDDVRGLGYAMQTIPFGRIEMIYLHDTPMIGLRNSRGKKTNCVFRLFLVRSLDQVQKVD